MVYAGIRVTNIDEYFVPFSDMNEIVTPVGIPDLDKIRDRMKESRRTPESRARNRETQRLWHLRNPGVGARRTREYREKNKDKDKDQILEKRRLRHAENPMIQKGYAAKRRARKASVPGSHTAEDIAVILTSQKNRCAACTVEFSLEIGCRFTVDHIIPLYLGGSNWPLNIQLLCGPCNSSKGHKHPSEWTPRTKMAASIL